MKGSARFVAAALCALTATACHSGADAVLLVVVTASGSPAPVSQLDVTIRGPAGASAPVSYSHSEGQPVAFPTTLSAVIPALATGQLTVDVRAVGSTGTIVATGREGPFLLRAGERQTVFVDLDCGGSPCVADGGVPAQPDGGSSAGGPSCGNGRVDPGETCDTAIGHNDPGACPPPDCSDGVACTRDLVKGDGCTLRCTHTEITTAALGDFCCPTGATADEDSDCSPTCGDGVVDAHESCDTAILPGMPGACPMDVDCVADNLCLDDRLISAGTCSAICVHYPRAPSDVQDGCCPPDATHDFDPDCPTVCGNGVLEIIGAEKCDPGIAPPSPGACPTVCPAADPSHPPDPCNPSILTGTGCQAACVSFQVTAPISGDGCCPFKEGQHKYTHAEDTDCPGSCGDGVLEPGEACDKGAPRDGPLACPTACTPLPSACLKVNLVGSADDCSAHCVTTAVTACSLVKDGCCPSGCTGFTDADCSIICGNGTVDRTSGETCDQLLRTGPGSCLTSCPVPDRCFRMFFVGEGTCSPACIKQLITEARAGDGCCPYGADATNDSDCVPRCDNGIVEGPSERCDVAVKVPAQTVTPGSFQGSCPTSCQAISACTPVHLEGADTCGAATCVATPITSCSGRTIDGCCPTGCTSFTDDDCPAVCGDGVLGNDEICDRAITAGAGGACPRTCDDGNDCTMDVASGSVAACTRTCRHVPITNCISGDGCCPPHCSATNDSDCAPRCGDGRIGSGETCDPPASCPIICADDGDPCTRERLEGDPRACTAVCRHDPITACSGGISDACCPTGCTGATDTDC